MNMDTEPMVQPQRGQTESHVDNRLKYGLLCFAMLFWVVGAFFVAVGGYVISQNSGYEELSDFATDPGIILATLGVIIFSVSSFGVLGSLRENIFLLEVYRILLGFVLLFEVFCGIVGFAFWPEIKKLVDKNIASAIEKYSTNADLRNMIDKLQRELECCGSLSIDDWDSNPYFSCKYVESYRSCGVPWSCCLKKYERNRQCGYGVRKNRAHLKLENEIHTVGCLDKGFEYFYDNIMLVAGLAIGFSLPLVLGMFATGFFLNQIRRQIEVLNGQKIFL